MVEHKPRDGTDEVGWQRMTDTRKWTEVPPTLTIQQCFRLIEIAHETRDDEIRRYALNALAFGLSPIFTVSRAPPCAPESGIG